MAEATATIGMNVLQFPEQPADRNNGSRTNSTNSSVKNVDVTSSPIATAKRPNPQFSTPSKEVEGGRASKTIKPSGSTSVTPKQQRNRSSAKRILSRLLGSCGNTPGSSNGSSASKAAALSRISRRNGLRTSDTAKATTSTSNSSNSTSAHSPTLTEVSSSSHNSSHNSNRSISGNMIVTSDLGILATVSNQEPSPPPKPMMMSPVQERTGNTPSDASSRESSASPVSKKLFSSGADQENRSANGNFSSNNYNELVKSNDVHRHHELSSTLSNDSNTVLTAVSSGSDHDFDSHNPVGSSPGAAGTTPANKSRSTMNNGSNKFAIPTPAYPRLLPSESDSVDDDSVLFPHLTTTDEVESPQREHQSGGVDDDDDAFLPDDFKEIVHTGNTPPPHTDSIVDPEDDDLVQAKIEQAREEVERKMAAIHEQQLRELQEQAEHMLKQHGEQWKVESEQEYQRMNALVKEERARAHRKHLELTKKEKEIEQLLTKTEQEAKGLPTPADDAQILRKDQLEEDIQALQKKLVELRTSVADTEKEQQELLGQVKDVTDLAAQKKEADCKLQLLQKKLMEQEELSNHDVITLQQQLEAASSKDDLSKTSAELEKMTEERNNLQGQLSDLELKSKSSENDMAQQVKDLQLELEGVKRSHSDEMELKEQSLQKELEALKEKHADERKTWEQEKTELKTQNEQHRQSLQQQLSDYDGQLQKLKDVHKDEVQAAREDVTTSMQEQLSELQKQLESSLEARSVSLSKEEAERCNALQKTIDELTSKLDHSSNNNAAELNEWKNQVTALQEQIESSQLVKLQLQTSIEDLQKKHKEDLTSQTTESQAELAKMQQELQSLQNASKDDKSRLEGQLQTLQSEVEQVKFDRNQALKAARDEAKQEMEQALQNLESQLANMQADDSTLTKKIADLQARTDSDKQAYERQVQDVRSEHDKEMEDILSQLDMVEAEHLERSKAKDQSIRDKDAVISALGNQLAEVQATMKTIQTQHSDLEQKSDALQTEFTIARNEVQVKKEEVETLKAHHDRLVKQHFADREKAIDAARDEMIERAEIQFEQRNVMYKKLKHEYDSALSDIATMEKKIDSAERLAAESRKESQAREVDLNDQLAQAKAAVATMEAGVSRQAKQHLATEERLDEVEKALRGELEQEQSTCRSIQSTLASVVAEKEKLINECNELRAVSEELMTMVETNQLPATTSQ